MSIHITCINCGEKFEFSDAEQRFFQSKGLESPKRCKDCRKSKKTEENVESICKLGYKRSSFLDNARIYGMGIPVEGGVSIDYKYVFKLQLQDEVFYLKFDKENKKLYRTKDIQKATSYVWSSDLKNIQAFLEKEYPEVNVTLYPIPSVSHLRD